MNYAPELKQDFSRALPFIVLFVFALFLPSAAHRIVFYALTPVFAYFVYKQDFRPYIRTYSFGFLVAYILYFSSSPLWSGSEDTFEILKFARNGFCILLFAAALVASMPAMQRLPKNLALVLSGIVLLYGVWLLFTAAFTGQSMTVYRLEGIGRYQNTIHFSFLLSLMVLWLVSLGKLATRTYEYARLGLIFVFMFFISLTKARSAFIALAGCVGLLGVLGKVRVAATLFGFAVVGALLSFVVWDFSWSDIVSRSDNYRFGIWKEAYTEILQKPLLGHGVNAEPGFNANDVQSKGWESTHNVFLGHGYTGGFIGLALFTLLFGNMFLQSFLAFYKNKSSLTQLACMSVCYALFAGLFNFSHFVVGVHIQWLVFWMPFALTWYLEGSNKTA